MDLIDRQAAIDTIVKLTTCNGVRELFEYVQEHHLSDMWSGGIVDAIDAVIGVPSAQPEIIRCKDCRHRIVNDHYGEKGYLNIKGYCELDTGDPFELGRNAENDDWFCADAERRTDE